MTTYTEKVAEGRTLVKRSEEDQWRLAELTWSAIEEDGKSVTEWAADVGIGQPWATTLRQVWGEYSVRNTDLRFWDAVQSIKHGVPVEDARQTERDALAQRTVRNATPEKRAEIARELLADEIVADAALNTPEARTPGSTAAKAVGNVARATEARRQEEARRTERIASEDPVSRRIDEGDAIHDLGAVLDRYAKEGAETLRRVGSLPDVERKWLEGSFGRASVTHESIRRYLELGRSEIDHELEQILNGGESHAE